MYAVSGVNIDAGNRAVDLMRDAVRATYNKNVLAGIGAFGGLFDASNLQAFDAPVLVASTDGVGTKVKLAAQAGRFDGIGADLVNHCINDILVQGARPLFFLDYIASSKLVPENVAAIVASMAEACRAANCVLLGGETAEMPGVYLENEFDVAGTIVGVVERANILPHEDVGAGDMLIGLRSAGPHTNGFSLIRKIFAAGEFMDELLLPHRSYLSILQPFLHQPSPLKALAHITGGGIIENLPRVLPENVAALIRLGSWEIPPVFQAIQARGGISTPEMFRVFNMGIGMIAIVACEEAGKFQDRLGEESFIIGELVEGEREVALE